MCTWARSSHFHGLSMTSFATSISLSSETGEPLPKKPLKSAHLVSLTTSDQGESWQLAQIQQLTGKSAKETPCDVS